MGIIIVILLSLVVFGIACAVAIAAATYVDYREAYKNRSMRRKETVYLRNAG